MANLLNIQASPGSGDLSVSRLLSNKFVEQWRRIHPNGQVIVRDLMSTSLPFLDTPWIAGAFIPNPTQRSPEMKAALAISDELVAEIKWADQILIGTPMFNFSIPAVLKAYIDHIVRLNETFTRENGGLLKDKSAKIILAAGRLYTPGTPEEGMDYASAFLKGILGYIGITDVEIILAGGSGHIRRGLVKLEDHIAKFEGAVKGMAV
jgi:FMN-dependent NADH-azoreductase